MGTPNESPENGRSIYHLPRVRVWEPIPQNRGIVFFLLSSPARARMGTVRPPLSKFLENAIISRVRAYGNNTKRPNFGRLVKSSSPARARMGTYFVRNPDEAQRGLHLPPARVWEPQQFYLCHSENLLQAV